jgi:hypothetical protein
MTTTAQPLRTDPAAPALLERADPPPPKRSRPVIWWAALGAAVVGLQLYVYVAWMLSSDFKRTPTGADPVPHTEKVFAWILQPLFVLMALGALWWVVRGCRRQGSLTLDAKLLIAGYCQVWLDPVGCLVRPQFFFNSYYFNRGSWLGHIPGVLTPNAHRLADLPFVEVPLYGCFIGVCVGGCALMRWIRRRRPQTSNVALVLWTWAAVCVFILVFEELLILRTGVAMWEATPPLTFFDGTRFEMSLFPDPVFWGGFITAMVALRFFSQNRKQMAVESGLERVTASRRVKTGLSTFAVIGYVSAAMLIGSAGAVAASLYSRTPAHVPSYLRDGICGPGTAYQCPNPGVPIYTK